MSFINNSVLSLIERDEYDKSRVKIINDAILSYSCDDMLAVVRKNRNVNEKFSINENLPNLIGTVIKLIKLYTDQSTLSNKDYKYVIFGIILRIIVDDNQTYFTEEMEIQEFIALYDNIFDLVLIVPQIVVKTKTSCGC